MSHEIIDIINVPLTSENIDIVCSVLGIHKEALWLSEEDTYINVYHSRGVFDAVSLKEYPPAIGVSAECTPEIIKQALLEFNLNN